MRKTLLLALVLVLGLLIFNGCGTVNNPMEVENTYTGSTKLNANSIDETQVYELAVEIVNENSNGNLVYRFYHESSTLVVNSIKIDENELAIVNYNCIEPRSVTQLIVSAQDISLATALVVQIDLELEGTPIVLTAEDRTYDYQIWNQPVAAFSVSYTKIIDENGKIKIGMLWIPEVDDEVLVSVQPTLTIVEASAD